MGFVQVGDEVSSSATFVRDPEQDGVSLDIIIEETIRMMRRTTHQSALTNLSEVLSRLCHARTYLDKDTNNFYKGL